MRKLILGLLLSALFPQEHLEAAVVVTTGNGDGTTTPVSVSAGQTGVVIPVLISSTGSDLVDGFDLGFDFSINSVVGDGAALPPVFTNVSIDASGSPLTGSNGFLDLSPFPAAGRNVNYRFTRNFDSTETITGPVNAFNITFDVAGGATPGDIFQLNFVPVSNPSNATEITGAGAIFAATHNNGSIQISGASGVPEPTSVLALTGVFAVGGVRRWRKKKVADVSV